jgi:hypothetical protein
MTAASSQNRNYFLRKHVKYKSLYDLNFLNENTVVFFCHFIQVYNGLENKCTMWRMTFLLSCIFNCSRLDFFIINDTILYPLGGGGGL